MDLEPCLATAKTRVRVILAKPQKAVRLNPSKQQKWISGNGRCNWPGFYEGSGRPPSLNVNSQTVSIRPNKESVKVTHHCECWSSSKLKVVLWPVGRNQQDFETAAREMIMVPSQSWQQHKKNEWWTAKRCFGIGGSPKHTPPYTCIPYQRKHQRVADCLTIRIQHLFLGNILTAIISFSPSFLFHLGRWWTEEQKAVLEPAKPNQPVSRRFGERDIDEVCYCSSQVNLEFKVKKCFKNISIQF